MNLSDYTPQKNSRHHRQKREVLLVARLLAVGVALWLMLLRAATTSVPTETWAGAALNLLQDSLLMFVPALVAAAAGAWLASRLRLGCASWSDLFQRAGLTTGLFALLLAIFAPLVTLAQTGSALFAVSATENIWLAGLRDALTASLVSLPLILLALGWLARRDGTQLAGVGFRVRLWPRTAQGKLWMQRALAAPAVAAMLWSLVGPVAATQAASAAPPAGLLADAAAAPLNDNTCTSGGFERVYNVSAIHVDIPLNNFGDHDPAGYMYVLDENIDAVRAQEASRQVSPGLRDDPIQALVIRANLGDCLVINFTNRLNTDASISIQGLPYTVDSAGSQVGHNPNSFAAPGQLITYRWSTPTDPNAEGAYYFRSHGASRQQVTHGLFGGLVLEPAGSSYLHPETRQPMKSGWEAIIQDPNGVDFREFVIMFHEVGDEDADIFDKDNNKLPVIDSKLSGAYRPGSRALNYRSEPFYDRFKLRDDAGLPFDKAHGYSSYAYGDPATPIPRSYLNEPTKTRIMHGGSELFHVYHLHGGAIRWRRNPKNEPAEFTGGLKKVPTQNAHSTRLDSQGLGPSEAFTLEHECGAGGCQQSAGDFLWHCHIGHHYVAGMWSFWRVFDSRQPDLAVLPDMDATPAPQPVNSLGLVGKVIEGKELVPADQLTDASTQRALEEWIEAQLPPPGVPLDTEDATVWNWSKVNTPTGPLYLGEPETGEVWPNYASDTPGQRPEILFNPDNGRYAWPLFKPHLGQRPPFSANGHSGAPWLGETGSAERPDGLCPSWAPNIRNYPITAIELPIQITQDRIDPVGMLYVLSEEKDAVRNGQKPAEPLTIRSNVGDCVDIILTSEQLDENHNGHAKVNLHQHFVQFDPQASDGVITGMSYEQSIRPYATEGRTLTAAAAAGDSDITVNHVNRLRTGIFIGVGLGDADVEVRKITAINGTTITLDRPLDTGHSASAAVGVEFVRYRWFSDVDSGNVFFHDHVNFKNWDHGLFGAHIVEPPGSTYHDPVTGAELRSGTVADIHTSDPVAWKNFGSFRELMVFLHNDNPATGEASGGTLNLRAEPLDRRGGEPAYAFSSVTHGDPKTPVLRAYVGDPVVIRGLGVVERVGALRVTGHRFRSARFAQESDLYDTMNADVSERFDVALDGGAGGPAGLPGDYLFYSTIARDFVGGAWGLLRVHDSAQGDLQALPGYAAPSGGSGFPQQSFTGGVPAASVDTGAVCPANASLREYDVSIFRTPIEFYAGNGGTDSNGIVYALSSDEADIVNGVKRPEPLVIRANAGECLKINLTNHLNERAGLNLGGKVLYNPQTSYGAAIGYNPDSSVAPNQNRDYYFYADVETGTNVMLNLAHPATGARGAFGAVVIEPEGAVYRDHDTGAPLEAGTYADIITPNGSFREFVTLFQDEDDRIGSSTMPYKTKVSGFAGINYTAMPFEQRLNANADPTNIFDSDVHGEPASLYEAYTGDPLRYRVAQPWGEQAHVFAMEGHRWKLDSHIANANQLSSKSLRPGEAFEMSMIETAGSGIGTAGDYLFMDMRLPFQEAGLWGMVRTYDTPQDHLLPLPAPGDNLPPLAANDDATTTDAPVIIPVLANDSDLDGAIVSATVTITGTGPFSGTATANVDGTITYTPTLAFVGLDTFDYVVEDDGGALSNVATVQVTVTGPANNPPLAANDAATTDLNTTAIINVAANDTDLDGNLDVTTIALSGAGPANGSVAANLDGTVIYTPTTNFSGVDTFNYTIADLTGLTSNVATVTVTVTDTNILPVADPDPAFTQQDTAVAINVLGNDTDADGSLVITSTVIVTAPLHGTAVPQLDGTVAYTPTTNFSGVDVFHYNVTDNEGGVSNTAAVTVTVNARPVANDDNATTSAGAPVNLDLTGNDTDSDGVIQPETLQTQTGPFSGTLSVRLDGTATYTPATGFEGQDWFSYTVQDDRSGISNVATATITVSPLAVAPTYLSLSRNRASTAGSLTGVRDEDILRFTGNDFEMVFDGSDVLPGALDVDAFHVLDANSLLMSFHRAMNIAGLGLVDDSDIVRFDATSLGDVTAGAFSLFFDGSVAGLTTNGEDVDAFTLLPDGRLLVSTVGTANVTNATGRDEDILAFTPATAGDYLNGGTWQIYFDGSDVGLGAAGSQDVNGVSVSPEGDIYLTTNGMNVLPAIATTGEDIFVCGSPTTGPNTACAFASALHFDGSAWGIAGNPLNGIDAGRPAPPPVVPPVANAGADRFAELGDLPVLDGSASTGDGLQFGWAHVSGLPPVDLFGADTANPFFVFPDTHDTLTFQLTVTDTNGLTDTDTVAVTPVDLIPPPSLKTVPVPEPDNLADFVKDRDAAIALGKALFWDMQVGSDGVQACATCHYHAGADTRLQNTVSPGPDGSFGVTTVNGMLGPNDFPFHKLADPFDRTSTVLSDDDDVTGSQGVLNTLFNAINANSDADDGTENPDPVFNANGNNTRQVTGRNAPSVINAVFNIRNFWDGRANFVFNGVNPFGNRDPNNPTVFEVQPDGTPAPVAVRLNRASLSSQAVGPVNNSVEMAWDGREFVDLAQKLLGRQPLAQQYVDSTDSRLGTLAHPSGQGLNTTYEDMIRAAFQNKYWDTGQTTSGGNRVIEANFSLFFGLAIQLYESTLVSDDSPYDRFQEGDTTALTAQQQRGLEVFMNEGRCIVCHTNATFTGASVNDAGQEPGADPVENLVELMVMGDGGISFYDSGFYNIGVRPTAEDLGVGGTDPFGNPLSFSRLAQNGVNIGPPFLTNPAINPNLGVNVDGAFKTPGLRNVELTAPYMHNGGMATLEEVVEFYVRGGDFSDQNIDNLDADIHVLPLGPADRAALVAFMKSLTDERVRLQQAPFDHPQLFIPRGHNPDGSDNLVEIPATGAAGGLPLSAVLHIQPGMAVTKTVDPPQVQAGDAVTFTVQIENTGDVPLGQIELADDLPACGLSGPAADSWAANVIDIGETWTLTCTVSPLFSLTNTVTVTATDLTQDVQLSADASAGVTVTGGSDPNIDIFKYADATQVNAGQTVTYFYEVSIFEGNIPLTNVNVSDDKCAPLNFDGGDTNNDGVLDPGELWDYSCATPLWQTTTNLATATGLDPQGNPVDWDDFVTVTVPDAPLTGIRLVKTTTTPQIFAGQTANFTYQVSNAGTDPLNSVAVTDPACGPVQFAGGDSNANSILEPGELWDFACSTTLNQSDSSAATASGVGAAGGPVQHQSAATVTVNPLPNPAIAVDKRVNAVTMYAGQSAQYSYSVTNPGDDPLANVTVSDDVCSSVTPIAGGDANLNNLLDPGEEWNFSCAMLLHQDTTNTATASGVGSLGDTVSAQDSVLVNVINPAISLEKQAGAPTVHTGDSVTYSLRVRATGDDSLGNVTVTDNRCSNLSRLGSDANGLLDPGEVWEYQCSATLLQSVLNTATASATDSLGGAVQSAPASAFVTVINSDIDVLKYASAAQVQAGETVTYTYDVALFNGTDPLSNVTISDDKCAPVNFVGGDGGTTGLLEVGETWRYECSMPLAQTTTNLVTVSGVDSLGSTVTWDDELTVDVIAPELTVTKQAGTLTALVGDTVAYTITVTNSGDTPLTNVSAVDDPLGAVALISDTLEIGQSTTGVISTVVQAADLPGPLTNTVTASAQAPDGSTVSAQANASVELLVPTNPAVTVIKQTSATTATVGDTVAYTVTVTNSGDTPLTNVSAVDDPLGAVALISDTLDIGQSTTGVISTVVQAADLPGPLTNTVTASGQAPDGSTVSAQADASVDLLPPPTNPALTLVKLADTALADVGDVISYTLTVSNTGDVPLTGVSVLDVKLGLLENIGDLPVGVQVSVTDVYTVTAADQPGPISNMASAFSSQTDSVTAQVDVDVAQADLQISKVDAADPVSLGDTVAYTVTVSNAGPHDARNVVFTDTLPAGASLVSADAGGAVCTDNGAGVTCGIGGLAVGQQIELALTVSPTVTGTLTNSAQVSAVTWDPDTGNNTATEETTVQDNTPPPPAPEETMLYLSARRAGSVPGLAFADEDVIGYNLDTGAWQMVFDGSDLGLARSDVDAFHRLDDGSLLLSFNRAVTLNPLGTVDDSDIVRFIPTSLGEDTAGTFEWFFDGSDVDLGWSGEDVDAVGFTPDGRLVVSTVGSYFVTNFVGQDEDLLVLNNATLGENTSGTWELYFDSTVAGLRAGKEDVWGVWIDPDTGQIHLTTKGVFSVPGLSGEPSDVFICDPLSLGGSAACSYSAFWQGASLGYGEAIDGFSIGPALPAAPQVTLAAAALLPVVEPGAPLDDPDDDDIDEVDLTGGPVQQLYLPLITKGSDVSK